ncbi:hypothetical protein DBR32_09280 [Taibaiella sp. KBW10]|nr:hypothetical protein DBR32_09280 [Taibaiella sp. KBW10]
MVGIVVDRISNKPIEEVSIVNVHTGLEVKTTKNGQFEIEVQKGQLVEFRIPGYDAARVNVKSDILASYYNIQLTESNTIIDDRFLANSFAGAAIDSIKRRAIYKEALEHYKLTGLDVIQHPFDALSKRNRMIWKFQQNYEYWERDKFIDYVFNDRLIVQLTQLNSDSLEMYKRLYRPNYNFIRVMNEYDYYTYIKETVRNFRERSARQEFNKPEDKPYEPYNSER